MQAMSHGSVWMVLTNRPHRPYRGLLHAASVILLWKVLCAKQASDDSGGFAILQFTFSFHLGRVCALYGPATGFAREGGLQNGYRLSPDAALRLARPGAAANWESALQMLAGQASFATFCRLGREKKTGERAAD